MARGITIRFQGAEGLAEKFKAMTNDARTHALEAAVTPAGEIIIDRMKEIVAVDTGHLKESLGMRVLDRTPDRMVVTMKTPAPHWHLIEFGHRMVGHKPGLKEVGHVPAKPFIRPAFDSTKTAMKNEIRDGIRDSVLGFTE